MMKTENPEGRFRDIYCTVILQYSFALHAISNILWSSCYVSYGPKDTGEVVNIYISYIYTLGEFATRHEFTSNL